MKYLLALPLLFGSAPAVSAHTYILRPAADTVVKQAAPDSNFGTSPSLTIRNGATGLAEYSFLRFPIPPLAGSVTSATLSLRVTGSIQEVGTYYVSMGDPTWAETSLTWNNWSVGSSFTHLGSQVNLSPGSNLNVNVAGWLGMTGVTYATASSANVTGQSFSSKEGSVKPTLTIVTSGSLPSCGPGTLLAELNSIVQTGNLLYACNYKAELSPTFNAWNGGSENKPVIAAAIALFDGPVINGTDYRTWWQSFFAQQASTTGSGHINYFKGSELFSNVYDASTVSGILVARYWANLNGHTTIRDLAGEYLRRTWYAWALATSPQPFGAIYRNVGSTRTWFYGQEGQCPTLALASPRSKMDYRLDTKRWLLAKFLGYNQTCYKLPDHKPVIDYVASKYSGAPGTGVSGLISADITSLQALINNTTIPSNLASVLGPVRMETDFHWLLWSDGRRATYYLGHQLNNNIDVTGGKHTVFTAMFNRTSRDLDLLFIENQQNVSCIDAASRRIFIDNQGVAGCSSTHWITLPPDNPTHHFVLGPAGWRICTSLAC